MMLQDLLKSPSSKPEEDDEDKDAVMLSTLKLLGAYVKMEENAKLIGELQEVWISYYLLHNSDYDYGVLVSACDI